MGASGRGPVRHSGVSKQERLRWKRAEALRGGRERGRRCPRPQKPRRGPTRPHATETRECAARPLQPSGRRSAPRPLRARAPSTAGAQGQEAGGPRFQVGTRPQPHTHVCTPGPRSPARCEAQAGCNLDGALAARQPPRAGVPAKGWRAAPGTPGYAPSRSRAPLRQEAEARQAPPAPGARAGSWQRPRPRPTPSGVCPVPIACPGALPAPAPPAAPAGAPARPLDPLSPTTHKEAKLSKAQKQPAQERAAGSTAQSESV